MERRLYHQARFSAMATAVAGRPRSQRRLTSRIHAPAIGHRVAGRAGISYWSHLMNQINKPTLMAHLNVTNAKATMDFYKRAFGAEEIEVSPDPEGKVMHATMRIAESMFMLNDEYPQMGALSPKSIGGTAVTLNLNFPSAEKVDAAWQRATDAGAKVIMPLANQFWGGRYGIVEDVSGHRWAFHAQVETPSNEEIAKRAAQAMK
jgi:PhnB protein